MTIKLSELRAAVDAMTTGPYRYDHNGWIESMDRGINHSGSETEVLTLGARNLHDDGTGVVELVNAAHVLLEIAEAAMALGPELVYLIGPRSERLRDALAKVSR